MKAGLRYKKRERKNKRAAENQVYHKVNKSRRRRKGRKRKEREKGKKKKGIHASVLKEKRDEK